MLWAPVVRLGSVVEGVVVVEAGSRMAPLVVVAMCMGVGAWVMGTWLGAGAWVVGTCTGVGAWVGGICTAGAFLAGACA